MCRMQSFTDIQQSETRQCTERGGDGSNESVVAQLSEQQEQTSQREALCQRHARGNAQLIEVGHAAERRWN